MSAPNQISRREFLRVSAVAGVGLVVSVALPGCKPTPTPTPDETPVPSATPTPGAAATPAANSVIPSEPTAWFEPGLFVKIANTGEITITVHRSEMGQGVRTALAMILADELEADWSRIRVEQAPADRAFGDQSTGGSESIYISFRPLRQAGAVARETLIAAAAQVWEVGAKDCYAEAGAVIHEPTGRRLGYGELVEIATSIPLPDRRDVSLKDLSQFRVIGTRKGQIDEPQMVDGSAVYGMDVRLPGMLYAVLARPPVYGGKLTSYDPAPAEAIPGVRHVLEVEGKIAVVAENTWSAIQGRQALEGIWDEGRNADLSTDDMVNRLKERAQAGAGSAGVLEALYEMPFLAHATMEPMNCTADVREDHCTVWAPTQDPQSAKGRAASIAGLAGDAVTVHVPLIGGGFGRRLEVDYVGEAVRISQAVGAPVQVVWTRQDDMQHDFYHPLSVYRVSANLDQPGRLTMRPYPEQGSLPTGYWRSVTNVPEAFAHECFLDELASELGRDPYELRLEMLPDRHKAVVQLAAEKAGWGTPLPAGWGRGLAFHSTWGATHVAQVAEVSVSPAGAVRVHRVVCAVDCGIVINPDMVEAQMEGGIIFGLSAALMGEITVENGRVQQSNFHDYPILRMDESPVIEVHIVPSQELPQGIGEMGVPPIAPAVANAIFAATGKRIRRLPIRANDLQ